MIDLLERRLLFFTGKGGVGKTAVAAAVALLAAERGKKVLLVEVDAKGNLSSRFDHEPVGFEPEIVFPGVHAMQMRTDESLREYLKLHVRVPVFGGVGPLARVLEFVANAAPGVKEILTVGKICHEAREAIEGRSGWDLVVVDAAASGHVIAQLDAPRAIRELVQVGPVRTQTEWMIDLLADPAITSLNVVTAPEEMPVNEAIDLVERARTELQVTLGAVVVNRVLPAVFTRDDESAFDAMQEPDPRSILTEHVGPGALKVLDAARIASKLRESRSPHLARLRDELDLPLLYLPQLFRVDQGLDSTRVLADSLGAELGL